MTYICLLWFRYFLFWRWVSHIAQNCSAAAWCRMQVLPPVQQFCLSLWALNHMSTTSWLAIFVFLLNRILPRLAGWVSDSWPGDPPSLALRIFGIGVRPCCQAKFTVNPTVQDLLLQEKKGFLSKYYCSHLHPKDSVMWKEINVFMPGNTTSFWSPLWIKE